MRVTSRSAIALAVVAGLGSSWAGPAAQASGPEEAAAARAQMKAEIDAAKQRTREALQVFLDRQRSVDERVAAGARIGYVERPEDAAALGAVLRDRSEPDTIRAVALRRVPSYYDDAALTEAIRILETPENGGPALKRASVDKLVVLVQFTPRHHDSAGPIVRALRGALRSPDAAVRREAMGYLAVTDDPVAVDLLKRSLAQPVGAPFSRPEAIQFLSIRDPRPHFEALRPFLSDPDGSTRDAAARALQADPLSQPQIRRMQESEG